MTQPRYEHLEVRPDDAYTVPEDGYYEVSSSRPPRLIHEKPGVPRAVLLWVFIAAIAALGIIAAALLFAVPARAAVVDEGASGLVLPDTSTSGTATYCAPTPRYCHGWGGKAMLGAVRSFHWGDTPYQVKVCRSGSGCVRVTVVSYCACPNTAIDLSPRAFSLLAPLRLGRIHVTVSTVGAVRLPHLPPTDTVGP